MAKKRNFWDVLVWIALGYILVWLVLKVTGVINTPEILLYSPAFAGVYVIGKAYQTLEVLKEDNQIFKEDLKNLTGNFRQLKGEHDERIRSNKCNGGKPNSSHG